MRCLTLGSPVLTTKKLCNTLGVDSVYYPKVHNLLSVMQNNVRYDTMQFMADVETRVFSKENTQVYHPHMFLQKGVGFH